MFHVKQWLQNRFESILFKTVGLAATVWEWFQWRFIYDDAERFKQMEIMREKKGSCED